MKCVVYIYVAEIYKKGKLMKIELIWADELLELDIVNNDPWALAISVGVSILSDKDLVCGHVDFDFDGGVVVSALFDAYDNGNNEYSFDTVVHRKYQGQGLGSELIQIAMDKYNNEILEMDPNAKLNLDVINENIVPFLERTYGLKVKEQLEGHIIMGKLRKEAEEGNYGIIVIDTINDDKEVRYVRKEDLETAEKVFSELVQQYGKAQGQDDLPRYVVQLIDNNVKDPKQQIIRDNLGSPEEIRTFIPKGTYHLNKAAFLIKQQLDKLD